MSFLKNKRKRKIFITINSVLLVFVILFISCAIYVNDYYHANTVAIEAFAPVNNVSMQKDDDNTIIYSPAGATTGFIFYPGGKVEYTAYIPLMQSIASNGVFCALVEMPFNLAVLDIDAADKIKQQYPTITNWYIGGHSLGGSMAASYLADNTNDFEGLVLLGSYSTADLSQTGLRVLSIYGSNDNVMNAEKYNANKSNLPADYTDLIIDGGCHAYFGVYGSQDGDGIPTITNEEQIIITTQEICKFLQ